MICVSQILPTFKEKFMSNAVRIVSIIIFYLSRLSKAKFFRLSDVIFLVRDCRGNLKLITLGSEGVHDLFSMPVIKNFKTIYFA